MQEWYAYVKLMANKYELDPNLCAALAAGESGKGNQEVRFCWVAGGKYHGPYNLWRGALKKYDITDWRVNTEVGIRRLANLLKSHGMNLHAALKHYNTDDKGRKYDRYVANIKRLQKQYKKRMVFIDFTDYAMGMVHEPIKK
jgi:soluble lytic murein transglycosylase-like protein